MDSINKNQPEDNYEDLTGEKGIAKMKTLADKAGTCFFCTQIGANERFSTRPMSFQKLDDDGTFWFLSANDSNKNREIEADSSIQLLFQGSSYSDFLNVYGEASINQDKAVIKELWNPILKTWFTEGIDDPRISVIKVVPSEAYYWDTKHPQVVGLIKRMVGAAIGKTLDDSIEGTITV
ncbi:MAG: pyridoxamine 5'-phosphate oxidase family protein [Bacteroidota bacterium]|nr:pyridoxamine 5'-phosphate oxidase family protein [Ferruginibacter sp.]